MSPLDTRVPALLLRLDRNPFHHGSLGAVRSLGRAGVEVHAFVETARTPLARSRYLRRAHLFDGDPWSPAEVERALVTAAERIGRRAVLIPMDDVGAITAASLADRLADRFLLPDLPEGLAERAADKAELAALCATLGVPHPQTAVPGSEDEAADAVRALGLPLVAKWSRPWLLPRGGAGLRSTTVVTSPAQARRLFAAAPRAGSRLLLQRMVPGRPGADWFFHGCFGADGACLLGGTGRKELSWPVPAGLTAVGSWLPNPALARLARRVAGALGYRGVLDMDFRFDAATGAYHLLDFNPRPGAQFRLFTDRSGLDVVRALHLDLTGRAVPGPRSARPGRVFVAENYGVLAALAARRRWRAGGGGVEWAWFSADDPAPFRAMAGGALRRGLRTAQRGREKRAVA
ncbi:ATP-grasp domain-containing protein [Streptomyces sp. PT12]|uniref:carboxylate--amine ligase n=1 Tax=Streptomyces sp. PT12 TaxID=1510197 RepID=UPI000DE4CC79|nr:ATP-grasp domain-containing protein [Streptomyces sp. PT12]RBM05533.1 ATP-grasp domain-containing protein [Streptomyces sp. PT12]